MNNDLYNRNSEIEWVYKEIEQKVLDHEIYQKTKDYSKTKEKIYTYLEIGKLLKNIDIKYGKNIIKTFSERLSINFGKKYTTSLLYKIKQFYNIIEKVPTLSGKLTWSHWYEMLSINDINKITYYAYQCELYNLDVRKLREKIKSNEYERLPNETKLKIQNNSNNNIQDFIKNPIIIHNPNNIMVTKEKVLQKLLLENIESFLEELGNGFTFIKSEYKIKIGNTYNYIDLLLFNYEYNSFIVIELKVTELKKEHIGQIEIYMNYIDNNVKKIYHNKTIGIIICKKDNKFIIEYSSDNRILSKEYILIP